MTKRKFINEFDLDAPTLPKEDRSEFRYQTRSVTSLYERCLTKKLQLGTAWKVLVEVVPLVNFAHHRNLLGVLVIQIEDEASRLLLTQEEGKAELVLEWLTQGLFKLSDEVGIDKTIFSDTADAVRAMDFRNIREWIKPRRSPDGFLKADIIVDHRALEARIIGRILSRDGSIISEQILATSKPDEFIFAPMMGSLHWVDEKVVELRSKDGLSSRRFGFASA
ncbi:hypothetical protein JR065_03075 [Xanthomonas sp. AmX2]|uniref:hypothetical protein n=1 Tax=Xanthomonas sp. TaxID=29446 RepID=UPI00197DEAD4|nr:hypothetical protein [Xanthomonas sp.]MBN6149309.1 hypothetical protein [Xanthomonas sp.]